MSIIDLQNANNTTSELTHMPVDEQLKVEAHA